MNIERAVGYATQRVIDTNARKATIYIDPKTVVKVTRRGRPDKRDRYNIFTTTVGKPNYQEREFIKKAPFAVGDGEVWLKFYPKK